MDSLEHLCSKWEIYPPVVKRLGKEHELGNAVGRWQGREGKDKSGKENKYRVFNMTSWTCYPRVHDFLYNQIIIPCIETRVETWWIVSTWQKAVLNVKKIIKKNIINYLLIDKRNRSKNSIIPINYFNYLIKWDDQA